MKKLLESLTIWDIIVIRENKLMKAKVCKILFIIVIFQPKERLNKSLLKLMEIH